jgi:hypothetical protein
VRPLAVVAAPAALACAMMNPQAVAAQGRGPQGRLALGAAATWEQSSVSGLDIRRTGVLLNGEAAIAVSAIQLRVNYRQANLSTSTAGNDREFIEGRALLGLRLGRWVILEAGPLARAYVTSGGTERWLLWEGSARFEARVLGPSVTTYAVLSRVLAGDVTDLRRAQAGEAGLTLRLGRSPVSAQLGYWIHQTDLARGLRVETIQGVLLAAGVTMR